MVWFEGHIQRVEFNNSMKASGGLQQSTPPSGFLVPTADFAPVGFKEQSYGHPYYGNGLVRVSYEAVDSDGAKMQLRYSETLVGYFEPNLEPDTVVYRFEYEGNQAIIIRDCSGDAAIKKEHDSGHINYCLRWDDNGKTVSINGGNFRDKDVTVQELKDMLKKLKRF